MNVPVTRPVVIFGTLRSASLARYCLEHDSALRVAAFTVDAEYARDREHEGLPLVAFEELETRFGPEDCRLLIPMGYQGINGVRRARYEAAKRRGYDFASYISSRASTWPDLVTGDNVMIHEHAIVQPFSRIGSNCIIRSGAHLSHHCEVADHAFVAAEAAMGGGCRIGEQAFLGVGSVLRDGIHVAARSFIGAGAVVIADTEADAVYVGNPARKLARSAMEVSGTW
ncbi:MAG: acetyltransferase [Burkholderiales bacterium]|nr:acetyltransferase [Burkholderiales bacterium]